MNLELIEKKTNEITIKLLDVDEAFAYLLLEELWADEKVEKAEYKKGHPYLDHPVIWVKVREGKPQQALKRAARNLSNKFKSIREDFIKTIS